MGDTEEQASDDAVEKTPGSGQLIKSQIENYPFGNVVTQNEPSTSNSCFSFHEPEISFVSTVDEQTPSPSVKRKASKSLFETPGKKQKATSTNLTAALPSLQILTDKVSEMVGKQQQ
jgi:hypothetical protein